MEGGYADSCKSKRAMLLGGRKVDNYAAGREGGGRRLCCWTGEALLGVRERNCWVVRPLRYWTGKALLGCAAGWERGDDGGLLDGAAGDKR
jgi:hypothetical protein